MPEKITPVPSIVTVRMPGCPHRLRFYNDLFDVKVGDSVFADGSYAGIRGRVTEVTTRFRVNLKNYSRIIACSRPELRGEFRPVAGAMLVSDPPHGLTASVRSALIPPAGDDYVLVSGLGYELPLSSVESSPDVSPAILARAQEYRAAGRVKFISVTDGVGTAFVEGTQMYEVSFLFNGTDITGLYCTCPYHALCKHSAAVMLMLREIMGELNCSALPDFAAFESGFFYELLADGGYTVKL